MTNQFDNQVHLSFNDVLLVPYDEDYCSVLSRSAPNVSSEIIDGTILETPIIASPMDTISSTDAIIGLDFAGAMGIFTRYIGDPEGLEKQVRAVKEIVNHGVQNIAVAVGVKENIYANVSKLCDAGVTILCFDIANGNHIMMRDALNEIYNLKRKYEDIKVIAGNVVTGAAAYRLYEAGANAVRVGIGSGAICSTRLVTGFGVPQFSAVLDCANKFKEKGISNKCKIISDGGIRQLGDVAKAIWAGADAVMSGYLFAGCEECPSIDGRKIYRGMASYEVHGRENVAPEGIAVEIKSKGSVQDVVQNVNNALRSALSLGNALNLGQFRKNVRAIRVSTLTQDESRTIKNS